MNTSSIDWFEIPVTDMQRAERFYATALQASFIPSCATSPQIQAMSVFAYDQNGAGVSGCLIQGLGYEPSTVGSMVYLNAEPSIDAALERVHKAGGEIVLKKTALPPGLGFFAHVLDSEGNRIGFHALQ